MYFIRDRLRKERSFFMYIRCLYKDSEIVLAELGREKEKLVSEKGTNLSIISYLVNDDDIQSFKPNSKISIIVEVNNYED